MTEGRASGPTFVDMAPLMGRLEQWLAIHGSEVRATSAGEIDREAFAARVGYWPDRRPCPEVIVGADVALDLGHPRTASESAVLLTAAPNRVSHRRIRWLGPDLPELASRAMHPFAQVLLLGCRTDALLDPFAIEAAQFLTHRLDGYMVRSIPGRLWVRLSRGARARGLDLETVGRALITTYEHDFPEIEAVEVLFVTRSAEDVAALGAI
ncbi:MAG: hypothetical protein JRI23_07880, partial [Deltaproteobacteria bacterium]|nr:hypothetical protein [Deltaproteobacteria bacterium]MBW2531525.1 hypothetical protein [Deltaproteobacteria bacterium]